MDPGVQMKKTGFACAHVLLLSPPKNVFLTFLALLVELNYSTWVQNPSHGANICFLCSKAGRDTVNFYSNGTDLLLWQFGLTVHPWEGGQHSEHINNKDSVLECLLMFSSRCLYLRYPVPESPAILITLNECFLSRRANGLDSDNFKRKVDIRHVEMGAGRGAASP